MGPDGLFMPQVTHSIKLKANTYLVASIVGPQEKVFALCAPAHRYVL
jgi:hypothetical protein